MVFDPDYICLATLDRHLGVASGCVQLLLVLRHEHLQLVQQEVRVEVPGQGSCNSFYVFEDVTLSPGITSVYIPE